MNRKGPAAVVAVAFIGWAASTASASAFTWPAAGMITSSYYTWRSGGYYHHAIDIAATYGNPVSPARKGTVSFRGWDGAYGFLVKINHESGYQTCYAHNSRFGSSGWVTRSSVISYIGSTGNSTGPHCHFEVRRYGSTVYVPGAYGWKVSRGQAVKYDYAGLSAY